MKAVNVRLALLLGLVSLLTFACDPQCDGTLNDQVGEEFFTVEYQDPSGRNYINEVYDPSGIVVFLDTTGGENPNPKYELISPGYEDGKFGPFRFTDRYVSQVNDAINSVLLFGREYHFDYFLKKDTYGQDTLRVSFLLDVDECHYYWRSIRYFLNGTPLTQYDNQAQAEILIVE